VTAVLMACHEALSACPRTPAVARIRSASVAEWDSSHSIPARSDEPSLELVHRHRRWRVHKYGWPAYRQATTRHRSRHRVDSSSARRCSSSRDRSRSVASSIGQSMSNRPPPLIVRSIRRPSHHRTYPRPRAEPERRRVPTPLTRRCAADASIVRARYSFAHRGGRVHLPMTAIAARTLTVNALGRVRSVLTVTSDPLTRSAHPIHSAVRSLGPPRDPRRRPPPPPPS